MRVLWLRCDTNRDAARVDAIRSGDVDAFTRRCVGTRALLR